MMADYEAEQERLKTEITVMDELIARQQEDSAYYDRFAALVEKYVEIPELTTTTVNQFVKKIIVHEADKSSGHRRQTVEIVFNFVGKVEIPVLTEPVVVETVPEKKKTAQQECCAREWRKLVPYQQEGSAEGGDERIEV